MLLKLKDRASTRTNGYKPVINTLRWDTARPQLAGRFENRAVGAKIIHFGRKLGEFKEEICTKWCLQQPGSAGSDPQSASQHGAAACSLWSLQGHKTVPTLWLACVPGNQPALHSR